MILASVGALIRMFWRASKGTQWYRHLLPGLMT